MTSSSILRACLSISTLLPFNSCKTSNVIKTENLPESGAAIFTWGSYFDTNLEVGNFFQADHTVMVRFMSHYERCYEGPLFR